MSEQPFMSRQAMLVLLLLIPGSPQLGSQTLKVATVNFWSGLNYRGVITMGEYEPDSTRERRLQILALELKAKSPDIIALQESNPVYRVASHLSKVLDYDCLYQRTNGGLKLGTIGIPWNLNEGLIILAKKELHLRLIDVWDLSTGVGVFGNLVSFHFQDQNIALVASVEVEGTELYLINTHLSSPVPDDSLSRLKLTSLLAVKMAGDHERASSLERLQKEAGKRTKETLVLLEKLRGLKGKPFVLLGDFNATDDSPEIRMLIAEHLIDAADIRGMRLPTWDPAGNLNIRFSLQYPEEVDALDFGGPLGAWYDSLSRRIDYIFLGTTFSPSDVGHVQLFLNKAQNGLHASDHYGVMAEIFAQSQQKTGGRGQVAMPKPDTEFLPILTYDTDVGFGYGGKCFLLNQLGESESFDLIVFNSTKGERWYRFLFSIPDFELRQGKPYPMSVDLIVDYDKYLKNNFFGIGNRSSPQNRDVYTKEPLEIQAVVSRGFSSRLVGQVGVKFKTVRNFDYGAGTSFSTSLSGVNHGRSNGLTFFSSFRYDSRNSFINPSNGEVVQLDLEAGSSDLSGDYSLRSATLSLQAYQILFYPKTIFAARIMGQTIGGTNLPVHVYASLGGNRTLRGYPQDRFLDLAALLSNAEVRFPIAWRFDGVLFGDAGRVSESIGQMSLFARGWKTSFGIGLRFLMDTFVVRADLGFSREGSGFYLNFGHIF